MALVQGEDHGREDEKGEGGRFTGAQAVKGKRQGISPHHPRNRLKYHLENPAPKKR